MFDPFGEPFLYLYILISLSLNRQGRFEVDQLISLPILSKLIAVILTRKILKIYSAILMS